MNEMPQYEFGFHGEKRCQETLELELKHALYKIYRKVTPAIKEMIVGKEVKAPDAFYRLKIQ